MEQSPQPVEPIDAIRSPEALRQYLDDDLVERHGHYDFNDPMMRQSLVMIQLVREARIIAEESHGTNTQHQSRSN